MFRGFARYVRWYLGRSFHGVRIARDGLPELSDGRPAIIYSNHPSWWDPLIYVLIADRWFPARESYGPMELGALGRYGILERVGVFGIEKSGPRGAARFLSVASGLLARPNCLLWVTAEGDFVDPRARPIVLRPGIAHLARRVPGAVIVPLAIELTFWNERFPELLLRFGPPVEGDPARDAAWWTRHLAQALEREMDQLAGAAMRRDPDLFVAMHEGRAGIGVYDLVRAARSAWRGERFERAHGIAPKRGERREREPGEPGRAMREKDGP